MTLCSFFYYLLNSKCKTTKISLSCGVWCTWLCLNVRWVCVCIVSTSLWLGNVQMSPGLAHPAPCNSCCKPCTVIVKCVSPILGKVVPEKPLYTKQNQFWYPVPILVHQKILLYVYFFIICDIRALTLFYLKIKCF